MGRLCAEQKRWKSKQIDFREFWDSCAQNKALESSKNDFQEFWDSCDQKNTSEISKHGLTGILGLLCAEQDVGNLTKCTFRNSGTLLRTGIPEFLKLHVFENSDV